MFYYLLTFYIGGFISYYLNVISSIKLHAPRDATIYEYMMMAICSLPDAVLWFYFLLHDVFIGGKEEQNDI